MFRQKGRTACLKGEMNHVKQEVINISLFLLFDICFDSVNNAVTNKICITLSVPKGVIAFVDFKLDFNSQNAKVLKVSNDVKLCIVTRQHGGKVYCV